jgi:hypothetical protein
MIFFGMGTTPKVCFLGGMGRRSLVISQTRKVGFFFNFSRNYFFGGVEWGVVGERGVGIFFFFFFCDIVI